MPQKKTNLDEQKISIKFDDETTADFALANLPGEIITRLALHGLSQKLGDCYAGAKDQAGTLTASVWESLTAGTWNVRGEAGPRVTQLARALVMKMKSIGKEVSDQDAAEKIADLDKDEKKGLTAALAPELAKVKLEDAQKAAENATAKGEIDFANL